VASQIFWLVATLNIVLALGFEMLVRKVNMAVTQAHRIALARGQHRDNWLACATIWVGHASGQMTAHELVMLAGAMLLAWLTQRAACRLSLLHP
jgi:hypothetical protein